MWIEELWLLGLVEKKKETRKSWDYYDTKNQRGLCLVKSPKHVRDTGNEIDLDHMQGMRQTEEPKKASSNMGLVESMND